MTENSVDTNPHKTAKANAKAAQAYAKATRPWYRKKRWWAAGVVLVAAAASTAGGGGTDDAVAKDTKPSSSDGNASAASSKETKKEETKKEEVKQKPAAKPMSVQAAAILKEFEGNEAAADIKYKGKLLRVTGEVSKVDTEFFDDSEYVIQVNGGGDFEFTSVNCNDQAPEDVAKIQIGQQITVVGEFDDGGDLGVELKGCRAI